MHSVSILVHPNFFSKLMITWLSFNFGPPCDQSEILNNSKSRDHWFPREIRMGQKRNGTLTLLIPNWTKNWNPRIYIKQFTFKSLSFFVSSNNFDAMVAVWYSGCIRVLIRKRVTLWFWFRKSREHPQRQSVAEQYHFKRDENQHHMWALGPRVVVYNDRSWFIHP